MLSTDLGALCVHCPKQIFLNVCLKKSYEVDRACAGKPFLKGTLSKIIKFYYN